MKAIIMSNEVKEINRLLQSIDKCLFVSHHPARDIIKEIFPELVVNFNFSSRECVIVFGNVDVSRVKELFDIVKCYTIAWCSKVLYGDADYLKELFDNVDTPYKNVVGMIANAIEIDCCISHNKIESVEPKILFLVEKMVTKPIFVKVEE